MLFTSPIRLEGVKIDCCVLGFVCTHFGLKDFNRYASFILYKSLFCTSKQRWFIEPFTNKVSCRIYELILERSHVENRIRLIVSRTYPCVFQNPNRSLTEPSLNPSLFSFPLLSLKPSLKEQDCINT